MPTKYIKVLSFCLLFLVLAVSTNGQSFEYVAEKFTKDHGLPDEYIKDLDIDSKGNLWILTRRGLLKFDGFTFEPIHVESILPFKELEVDANDNLWLNLSISERNELVTDRIIIYNTLSKKSLKMAEYCPIGEFDNSRIVYLWNDRAKNIYLSYDRETIFRYDGRELKKVGGDNSNLIVDVKNREPKFLSFRTKNQDAIITKDLNTGETKRYEEKYAHMYVWYEGEAKFKSRFNMHWTESVKRLEKARAELVSNSNDTLIRGSKDNLLYEFMGNDFYYITNEQLYVYNLESRDNINLSETLPSIPTNLDLLKVSGYDNTIWLSTNKGLIKVEKKRDIFQEILSEDNLSIREMLAISKDTLLICTESGLYVLDIPSDKILEVIHPGNQFYGIAEVEKGKYLLGTFGPIYTALDLNSSTTTRSKLKLSNGQNNEKGISAFVNWFKDKNNRIWMTSSRGICTYNDNEGTFSYMFLNEIGDVSFTDIVQGASDKLIFLLSDDGIFEMDVELMKVKKFDAFDNKVISFITQDVDDESIYWVGTRYEGLLKWKYGESSADVINEEDGLSHNNVHSIFEDSYNRLWLSTDYGISIYNKLTKEIFVILEENGIHENEMNRHSYCFVNDSLIYYGGINGIIKFNPYEVKLEDNSPEFTLKALNYVNIANNKSETIPIEKDKNEVVIRRYHGNANLIFDVPPNPFSNSLRYLFSSNDSKWSYTQGNFIDLSKLEEGFTNLFVSKKIGISEWSSPKTISIYKIPPFYRAYWFYGLLISLFSFGAFVYVNYRRVRILSLNRRISEEVDRKTKELYYKNKSLTESKTLNDQLFSIIGHDLRSPLISLNNISRSINHFTERGEYDEVKKLTNTVESNSKKTLGIIDRLIDWTERQRNMILEFHEVNILDCVNKSIFEHEEIASKKGVEVISNGKKWIKCISNEASLLVVLGNVISNAIKFSHVNGKVEVKFYRKNERIIIEIIDLGIGMDETQLDKLNNSLAIEPMKGPTGETGLGLGILLSSEIIKKINGTLHYNSEFGKGTTATISLPL